MTKALIVCGSVRTVEGSDGKGTAEALTPIWLPL
jgi:hypothetical protein